MDRRSFFGLAAGALALSRVAAPAYANLDGRKGVRLSVTWGMLGRMPVPGSPGASQPLGL